MPTSPLDARKLIHRAAAALGNKDLLTDLPGAVVPLSVFFAAEVDPRTQREKNFVRMRPETAMAVWSCEHGAAGKSPGVLKDAVSDDKLGLILDDVTKLLTAVDAASDRLGGSAGLAEEISQVRQAAAGGSTANLDRATAALFRAVAELGCGSRCNDLTKSFGAFGNKSALKSLFEIVSAVREKEDVVEQAIQMLQECYAHLEVKRRLYAIDPIQRLRLVKRDIPDLDDTVFHGRILDIFKELHDPHTSYTLPPPFQNRYAFLPFLVEDAGGRGAGKFVVTGIIPEFYQLMAAVYGGSPGPESCAGFGRGAEILYWNGAPMERAVWRNAERESGSNAASRFARSVAKMTVRSLSYSLPPEEDWVMLTFLPAAGGGVSDERREIIVPWAVWEGRRGDLLRFRDQPASKSVNEQLTDLHDLRKTLYSGRKVETAVQISGPGGGDLDSSDELDASMPAPSEDLQQVASSENVPADLTRVSRIPDMLQFAYTGVAPDLAGPVELVLNEVLALSGKRLGYLRIRSFDAGAKFLPNVFFGEVLRITEELMEPNAPDGLILDVRGNPGGIIENGEKILQLFTPRRIETARFHYRSTELLRDVVDHPRKEMGFERRNPLATVRDSLHSAVFGGSEFSEGFPLTDPDEANDTGQRYSGPVALITDGMCYSATDIFVAGFKDNRVAARGSDKKDLIIGTDANIGAGGACRWTHDNDLMRIGAPFAPLPPGYGMTVAIQRSTRAGDNSGKALEDFGVVPDFVRPLTKRDLLGGNAELIEFVCGLLCLRPRFHVEFGVRGVAKRGEQYVLVAWLLTENVRRIECRVDGVVQQVCSVSDGQIEMEVPIDGPRPGQFEVQGFIKVRGESCYELKAARRRTLGLADWRLPENLAPGAGT